jgi:hypothetical protein
MATGRNAVVKAMQVAVLIAATASACRAQAHPPHTWTGDMPVVDTVPRPNTWGIDVLLSNDGFGLGTFFRRELTPDLSLFANFSISEARDTREEEQYDPYTGESFVPGKLNRFMVLPLMFGAQYRLFREDIIDNFRPYVNAGAGPALIYVMPYLDIIRQDGNVIAANEVEYFSSIGKGHAHYTVGGFVGFGANFGFDRSSVFGVNFRYYFTYLYSAGIPSLIDPATGDVVGNKKDFGGFFITINIGTAF